MRKLIATLTVSLVGLGAFAQGKIGFATDSLHLVYWFPSGPAVNSDNMPAGVAGLSVDLYMGTSSSALYLYSSIGLSTLSGPGKWPLVNVLANANPATGASFLSGGTTVFVEVQVRDVNTTPPNIFTPFLFGSVVSGHSEEFTFTLGSGITYPALSGANGNWPVGTFNMDQYGVGSRGAIAVGIPEPSGVALVGLGAVAMLAVARRNRGKEKWSKTPEI